MTVRGIPSVARLALYPLSLALVAAPAVAAAAPVANARLATPVKGEQLGGQPIAWAMAALIAIVAGILIFTDDDEDPVSP